MQPFWWQTGVFYNVYVRSFKDSNGDGIGDLGGVLEKLDYFSDTLGVDALWLAAALDSPWADFGYDVSNYTGFHPALGDLALFDELLVQAHRRGLRIILDFIPNHSSDKHPWFLESRSTRHTPKRDWYIWADPKLDGSPPNNWLSIFGGPAWQWDARTGQYFMTTFLPQMPDLNWRNPQLKQAMFDVARFWLERGVDGFRIDCAHHIMKDPHLRDNPPNPHPDASNYKPLGEYDSQLHIHDREHPDLHGVWREFRALLDAYSTERPRAAFGEVHVFDWQKWAAFYGPKLDELHMPFNLGLVGTGVEWTAAAIRRHIETLESIVPPGAWPNYMIDNFDESRIASRLGPKRARVAAMLLFTLRGMPMLCYGEEIGMTDVAIPPEKEQDPFGKRVSGLGRDPARTPMQWSTAPHAGFSGPTTPDLWLPVAPDYERVNVERELAEPSSMLTLYRRLIAYRQATTALQTGAFRAFDGGPGECLVFERKLDAQRVLIALNFTDSQQPVQVDNAGRITLSTGLDRAEAITPGRLTLRPCEGVIIETEA